MTSLPINPAKPLPLGQTASNHRPVAKAIHAVNQSTTAKWVPINKSFITLTKIVLRAALERYDLANIAITLRCVTQQSYRHLILVNDCEDIQIAAAGRVEEFIISTEMPMTPSHERLNAAEAVSYSVDFGQQRLGYLVALVRPQKSTHIDLADSIGRGAPADNRVVLENLASLAEEIVNIVKRYQTRYRAIYVYGDQCYWIGNSPALLHLDRQLHSLARVPQPVLLRGNKGTGKIVAARALHCARHTDAVPFIESACHEWQEGAAASILQALYVYAKGGTLFLRNIDKLSATNLQALQQFLFVRFADSAQRNHSRTDADAVSLILSTSQRELEPASDLAHWLAMNVVDVCLPDLAQRREDIRDLARFFIREYAPAPEFDFHEDAWALLENYQWQGNVEQLRYFVQQVTLGLPSSPVSADQLYQWTPTAGINPFHCGA